MPVTSTLRRNCEAILIATAIALSTANALAATPQDLKSCEDNTDVPRMVAACTNLSQDARLPPEMRSMAFLKRGFGNFALGNIDAAQADFSEAIRLNPKNNYAHHELGLSFAQKGDHDRAIVSLTEAISLDPTSAASRFSRGQSYLSEDKLDDAIRDFTDAIRLGADKNTVFTKDQTVDRPQDTRVSANYYAARADAYYLRGNFKDAASDYDRAAGLFDQEGYYLIWGWIARARGDAVTPNAALTTALNGGGQLKEWPKSVGELLVGRITPAAAMAAAKDADQTCEAHYYTGIISLKNGDRATAQREFTSARDGCPKSFREYRAAIADLKRMQ